MPSMRADTLDLSIVLVNWNAWEMTAAALEGAPDGVVDDEPVVLAVSKLAMKNFEVVLIGGEAYLRDGLAKPLEELAVFGRGLRRTSRRRR